MTILSSFFFYSRFKLFLSYTFLLRWVLKRIYLLMINLNLHGEVQFPTKYQRRDEKLRFLPTNLKKDKDVQWETEFSLKVIILMLPVILSSILIHVCLYCLSDCMSVHVLLLLSACLSLLIKLLRFISPLSIICFSFFPAIVSLVYFPQCFDL